MTEVMSERSACAEKTTFYERAHLYGFLCCQNESNRNHNRLEIARISAEIIVQYFRYFDNVNRLLIKCEYAFTASRFGNLSMKKTPKQSGLKKKN